MKHVQNQILKYKISTTNMLQNLNSGCRSVRCFFSRGLLINSKLNELQCKNNKVLKTFYCSSNRQENAILKENLLANIYLNLNYNEMLYLRIYKQFFLMCHHTKQIIFNNHYAFPKQSQQTFCSVVGFASKHFLISSFGKIKGDMPMS